MFVQYTQVPLVKRLDQKNLKLFIISSVTRKTWKIEALQLKVSVHVKAFILTDQHGNFSHRLLKKPFRLEIRKKIQIFASRWCELQCKILILQMEVSVVLEEIRRLFVIFTNRELTFLALFLIAVHSSQNLTVTTSHAATRKRRIQRGKVYRKTD